MKFLTYSVVALLFLQGCGNCISISKTGTEIDSDKVGEIIIGKTTKAEITAMFGIPDQVVSQRGSAINIRESMRRDRSRSVSGNISGGVHKKNWGVAAGDYQGDRTSNGYAKTRSMSTPSSAIAGQGDVFEYRRVKDAIYNCFKVTYESSTAEVLTVVFDKNDVVLSFDYKD